MSWIEVDWKQERPSEKAAEWLWRSIEVRHLDGTLDAVASYLSELRRLNVNGDPVFARFEVSGNHDFDWFATRNCWDEIAFFSRFLTHPAVRATLPDLTTAASFADGINFECGSSLLLDGELARALVIGGAYKKFEGARRQILAGPTVPG